MPNAVPNVCKIKVVGVGGGGNNAINRMLEEGVVGAEFVAVNTDLQALMMSKAPIQNRIQIGKEKTQGLGAGSFPEIGEKAAEESRAEIEEALRGVNLLFITAGMGGGTGTGAAPVIARIAKDLGCVTVAVVTKPFAFEGKRREENAKRGIANLAKFVDTLIVIPNDKIIESLDKNTSMVDAFKLADSNLKQAICGISDLITIPGLINLDFADIKTVIQGQGLAHMGVGRAKGENRIVEAIRQAVTSPMLETTIEGARNIILNITGDPKMSIGDVYQATDLVHGVVDYSANIIWGTNTSPDLQDEVVITVIATGFVDGIEKRIDSIKNDRAMPDIQPTNVAPQVSETPKAVVEEQASIVVEEAPVEEPKKEIPPFVKKLFGKK
ncbi:MAG: cell division protein FtsZ [Clostridia bacterium]|nr:cell division protein FtsZ [Clostridia bacterium]